MDRVYERDAIGVPPAAPAAPSTGYPVEGTPGTQATTKPGAYWYYMMNESMVRAIEAAGLTPDHTNLDLLTQAFKGISKKHLGNVLTRTWTQQTAAEANLWQNIDWSPTLRLMAAVSNTGTNRIMTSPDGRNWSAVAAPSAIAWYSMKWASWLDLFVSTAVASGNINSVMTSPDGINWTLRAAAEANGWPGLVAVEELGLLVAIADSGTNRVMTSPDGINWTSRTAAENNTWQGIDWASWLGLLVAVGLDGTNRIMTSPDGINWTARAHPGDLSFRRVKACPELQLLVATAEFGTGNRVVTSPDGINWSVLNSVTTSSDVYYAMDWAPDLGMLVMLNKANDDLLVTEDGVNWRKTRLASGVISACSGMRYCEELNLFVAIRDTGTNRVIHSL